MQRGCLLRRRLFGGDDVPVKTRSLFAATVVRLPRRWSCWLGGSHGLAALVLVTIAGVAACYRPSLQDGGLVCSMTRPYCPEGYACAQGHCYRGAVDAAISDAPVDRSDAGGTGGGAGGNRGDASASDGDAGSCVPRQAAAGCAPRTDLTCDPVCQTGCCTTEKCTALNQGPADSTVAALGCQPGPWVRKEGENCDVQNAGTDRRTDNCQPGLLCVAGDAEKICMRLCRGDGDCTGGVTCESRQIERPGTYMASVCGLPHTDCDPVGGVAVTGCPAGRTCYLVRTASGDSTVCDISSGESGNGASCRSPIDCLPGWTCPQAGAGAGRCRPVCAHDATSSGDCPVGLTCQATGTTYDLCL